MASEELLERIKRNNEQLMEHEATRDIVIEIDRAKREAEARGVRPTRGRLGIVDPADRAATRRSIAGQPGLQRFAAEAAPGTLGAAIGGVAGSAFGPVGTIAGAGLGGLAGEALGQEAGVTPESDVGLAVSGVAPLAGPIIGSGMRRLGLAAEGVLEATPMVRTARGIVARQEAADATLDRLSSNLLAMEQGLSKRTADDLFGVLARTDPAAKWNKTPSELLANTRHAAERLPKEFDDIKTLFDSGEITDVSFREVAAIRMRLKEAATAGSKQQKTAARKLLSGLEKDMAVAMEGTLPGKGMARLANAAMKRQRLEFAVQDFQQMAFKHVQPVKGSEDLLELNISKFRKEFLDATDPRSAKFDKQFAEALEPTKQEVNSTLAKLEELAEKGKPGGPGALVVQGRLAGLGAGAGAMVAGPAGAAVGALSATSIPRILTSALSNKSGRRLLTLMAKQGRGRITAQQWTILSEVMAQIAMSASREEEPE